MAGLVREDAEGADLAEDLRGRRVGYFEMRSMLTTLSRDPPLPRAAEKSKTSSPVPVIAFFTVDSKAKASVTTVVSVQNTS